MPVQPEKPCDCYKYFMDLRGFHFSFCCNWHFSFRTLCLMMNESTRWACINDLLHFHVYGIYPSNKLGLGTPSRPPPPPSEKQTLTPLVFCSSALGHSRNNGTVSLCSAQGCWVCWNLTKRERPSRHWLKVLLCFCVVVLLYIFLSFFPSFDVNDYTSLFSFSCT